MIDFQNVSKDYNGSVALCEVNIKIDRGDFVFIIGPSGAGKTTLLKLLIREELPSAGSILYESTDITALKRHELPLIRREIGVVFQDFKLLPQKTARENVSFVLDLLGKLPAEQKELVPDILDLVDLGHKAECFPRELSGGEKQRLAIARALAAEPKVLAADEPTGMIDPSAAWNVLNLLNKINRIGTTVIMATHNADIVNTLRRRVVALEDGRVVRDERESSYAPS